MGPDHKYQSEKNTYLELHKILPIGPHIEQLFHGIRIRVRDLLITSFSASQRQLQLEGLGDMRNATVDAHEPRANKLVVLDVDYVDVEELGTNLFGKLK